MNDDELKTSWIVLPVFNDYISLGQVLNNINNLPTDYKFKVVIVDDASHNLRPKIENYQEYIGSGSISTIYLLDMLSNQGNQAAIAQGIKFAFGEASNSDMFIIMDSDGEDSPSSIPMLFQANDGDSIVVAKRSKQKKNIFLLFWHITFKMAFKLLIGKTLNFGNFSLLKYEHCRRIVENRKIETSYIGTLLLSGIKIKKVTIKRGERYEGKSRTSRDGLFIAGFQMLTVFSDKIFVRLLRIVTTCILFLSIGILTLLFLKFFTDRQISGYTSVMIAIFSTSLLQLVVLLAGLIMIQINPKAGSNFAEKPVMVRKVE